MDFEYVVEPKAKDPIFFGSKLERNTAPIGRGLAPFQKRNAPENFPHIGPGIHDLTRIDNKIYSKRGYGGLCSHETRLKDHGTFHTPGPTQYIAQRSWIIPKQDWVPFRFLSRAMPDRKVVPSPGTYNLDVKRCRRTKVRYNLGNPVVIPTIETICRSTYVDTCHKCGDLCVGDYWQRYHELYLCHLCWKEEKATREIYQPKELEKFLKIRNCSYFHKHEDTIAALRLLPQRKINKKRRIENYLDLYLKC